MVFIFMDGRGEAEIVVLMVCSRVLCVHLREIAVFIFRIYSKGGVVICACLSLCSSEPS